MPISGEVWLDPDQPRFSLPQDSCVGDNGPVPQEVTVISKGDGRASGADMGSPTGGPTSTGAAAAFGGASGKSRAQQPKENWVPGGTLSSTVRVGYDRDDTTDNNYVR